MKIRPLIENGLKFYAGYNVFLKAIDISRETINKKKKMKIGKT